MKNKMRKEYLSKRSNMNKEDVSIKSKQIFNNVLNTDIIENNTVFALTSSIKNEVDTSELAKYLLDKGKRVVFPKIVDKKMNFYEVKDMDDFKIGYYDIKEPISNEIIDKKIIDLVFTPGVVCTPSGYRIGFGGGYYDRFFEDYKGLRVGLFYDYQIVDDIETDVYDEKVNILITETNVYYT